MSSFDLQPALNGALVQVRPLLNSDRQALFSVASDPLIWEQHPVKNRYERVEFDRFFDESIASGGALLVTDRRTGNVIGSSRYYGYQANCSEVEIGWTFLARSHWGGKYNQELKQLMLEHAFKQVETVLFYVDTPNLRSQKAVEKIGGVRADALDAQGRCIFSIRREDYRA